MGAGWQLRLSSLALVVRCAASSRVEWVAVTHGLAFDLNMIERPISRDRRIAEVLDSAVPADRWSPMLGLKAKQERDKDAGKSFAMQIVTQMPNDHERLRESSIDRSKASASRESGLATPVFTGRACPNERDPGASGVRSVGDCCPRVARPSGLLRAIPGCRQGNWQGA